MKLFRNTKLSEHASDALPIMDADRLHELCEVVGTTATAEMLDIYVAQGEVDLGDLTSQLASKSADRVRRSAHAMVGAALSIGACQVVALLSAVEHAEDPVAQAISQEAAAVLASNLARIQIIADRLKSIPLTQSEDNKIHILKLITSNIS
ncbi:MAG: Hpt domain-containing protein [Novosphingobium sp.]